LKFTNAGILLKSEKGYIGLPSEKLIKINGNSIYGKCRYEIQEQKEVPVWYTGI
jgi:hypothetical protein